MHQSRKRQQRARLIRRIGMPVISVVADADVLYGQEERIAERRCYALVVLMLASR